jgi:hypothetical protein
MSDKNSDGSGRDLIESLERLSKATETSVDLRFCVYTGFSAQFVIFGKYCLSIYLTLCLGCYPEDGGRMFRRNVANHLQKYATSHPRRH